MNPIMLPCLDPDRPEPPEEETSRPVSVSLPRHLWRWLHDYVDGQIIEAFEVDPTEEELRANKALVALSAALKATPEAKFMARTIYTRPEVPHRTFHSDNELWAYWWAYTVRRRVVWKTSILDVWYSNEHSFGQPVPEPLRDVVDSILDDMK